MTQIFTRLSGADRSVSAPVQAAFFASSSLIPKKPMFLQTPVGILVFVGIPVVAFIAYDAIRITLYNRKVKQQAQTDKALADKDEEIARLRALVDQQQADPAPSAGQSAPPEVIEIEAEVEAAPTEPAYEEPVSDDKAE